MDSPKWAAEAKLLAELIDRRFESRAEFAKLMDVSDDVLSNLCRGVTRLRGERKKKALTLLNVPEASLRPPPNPDRESQRDRGPIDTRNLGRNVKAERVGFLMVPIYGSVPAGHPASSYSDAAETVEMAEWGNSFDRWGRVIIGDSMVPEFEDGDIVIFENRSPQHGKEYGQGVYARKAGEDTFKVIVEPKAGVLEFWPLNDAYEPFSAEGWEILGVVVRRIRRGERGLEDERKYPFGFTHRFRTP